MIHFRSKINLMLRTTGDFCDVTIFCGSEVRFAHRCVIASASDRLRSFVSKKIFFFFLTRGLPVARIWEQTDSCL